MEQKDLIKALIADHIRCASLFAALENTGFISTNYYPQLGKTIMKIMGIKSTLALMYYLNLVENCCKEKRDIEEDAEDLYNDLVWMKEELKNP